MILLYLCIRRHWRDDDIDARGLARYGKGGVSRMGFGICQDFHTVLYGGTCSRIGDENVVQKILYGGNNDWLYA